MLQKHFAISALQTSPFSSIAYDEFWGESECNSSQHHSALHHRIFNFFSKIIPDSIERGLTRSLMGLTMATAYMPQPKFLQKPLTQFLEKLDQHLHSIAFKKEQRANIHYLRQAPNFLSLVSRLSKKPATAGLMVVEELARNTPALALTFYLSAFGLPFMLAGASIVGGVSAAQAFGEAAVHVIDKDKDGHLTRDEFLNGVTDINSRKDIAKHASPHAAVMGVSAAVTFSAGVYLSHMFGNFLPAAFARAANEPLTPLERQVGLKTVSGVIDFAATRVEQKLAGGASLRLCDKTTTMLGAIVPGLIG